MTRAQEYLAQASALISTQPFTKEREAQARSLCSLAQVAASIEGRTRKSFYASEEERQRFISWIRTGRREARDLAAGEGAYPGSAGSGFVPIGFEHSVIHRLALIDGLWNERLTTFLRTPRGSAFSWPLDSDVQNKAVVISENAVGTRQTLRS